MTNGYDLIALCVIGTAAVAGAAYVAGQPTRKRQIALPASDEYNLQLTRIAATEGISASEAGAKALALYFTVHEAVAAGKQIWVVDDGRLEREIVGVLGQKSEIALLDVVASLEDMPDISIRRGQMGTVIEILESNVVLVEFADAKTGHSIEEVPMSVGNLIKLHHGGGANG